jgi:hypothetical protein
MKIYGCYVGQIYEYLIPKHESPRDDGPDYYRQRALPAEWYKSKEEAIARAISSFHDSMSNDPSRMEEPTRHILRPENAEELELEAIPILKEGGVYNFCATSPDGSECKVIWGVLEYDLK